ncbi:MAG: bifunctional diaminohydroxyphosphoribosylaminopyrimidine deaminase/5-amino-6-(5-phosphoribosylamino)uracil reductase RibD [Saprospiraceae bacterium]|nr:bifunctional diaminohydroxyphosphoribosylaminopyrimidine deaminase/5-amino-6-(5-phosphoribosylamino)uracil reductase RibD [Saprospiraceae bacterium]
MIAHLHMKRCFDLARLGAGQVAPNPMVGAVLVYQDEVIGEGYHKIYGGPHAEVMAVQSVPADKRHLISKSTLYVSLEPCCIVGKTPACTSLILQEGIPKVVISCLDQTAAVSGNGIRLLQQGGVEVVQGVLEEEGKYLARFRNTFESKKRPYIILKYAQSVDGFLGKPDQAIWLTNPLSKRLVHKWRTEVSAIACGSNTVLVDNPFLTARLYPGRNPVRILLDRRGRLSLKSNVFNQDALTWVMTENTPAFSDLTPTHQVIAINPGQNIWTALFQQMYESGLSTLLVEGGASILEELIKLELWDEARVFTSPIVLKSGIMAPRISESKLINESLILKDKLQFFHSFARTS